MSESLDRSLRGLSLCVRGTATAERAAVSEVPERCLCSYVSLDILEVGGGGARRTRKSRKKSLPVRGHDDSPQWWSGLVGWVGWHLQTWIRGRKWCGTVRCGLILRPVWRTNRIKPKWISGYVL